MIAVIYITIWGAVTNGWTVPLQTKDQVILFFFALSGIEFLIILWLSKYAAKMRLSGNQDYINLIKRKEDEIFDIEQENQQLQRDLAALQGKADMNEVYLRKFTDKPLFGDAVKVDQENGNFVSLNGMTKKEKEREAYKMKCDGYDKDEIAAELGIATGSVNVYISRGKKSYQEDGGDPVETETGVRYETPTPLSRVADQQN